jgi:hypothetical protein
MDYDLTDKASDGLWIVGFNISSKPLKLSYSVDTLKELG